MAFPQPFLDALTERNPIDEVVGQYVSLTRRGSNLFGLCPFHSEKTASFSVSPDKGIYYCFGCHAGGGVINFIMQIEGLDYPTRYGFLQSARALRSRRTKITTRSTRSRSASGRCARTRRGSSASSCSPPSEPRRRRTYKSARSAWRQSSASGLASARTRGRSLRTR